MRTTLYVLRDEPFAALYAAMPERISRPRWDEIVACQEKDSDVAEVVAELPGGLPPMEGEWVVLATVAHVLLRTCLAHCRADSYQVGSCDSFFADLPAAGLSVERLSPAGREAWRLFGWSVDVEGRRSAALLWWLARAARYHGASAGLLSPVEIAAIARAIDEIRPWMAQALTFEPFARDGQRLLGLVERAASGTFRVMGWEYGT